MRCPVCQSEDTKELKTIKTAIIEGSFLYKNIVVMECNFCTHGFIDFSDGRPADISNGRMSDYYASGEYAAIKYGSPIGTSFFIGNDSLKITQKKDGKDKKNPDWIESLISIQNGVKILPESPNISLDHFLEHCWDLRMVMEEASRVLKGSGVLHIAVPNYDRYWNTLLNVDPPYLFLIKEHIQHFTPKSLSVLCENHGLYPCGSSFGEISILGGNLRMPVMDLFFSKINNNQRFCYGAGRELMYLLENDATIKNIDGIIDDVPEKLGKKINGIEIFNSDIIPSLTSGSEIIITALYYRDEIEKKIKNLGFKGKIS